MHIDGWSLILQGINFIVLVVLLWRFLYRPVLGLIARRKQEIDKAFGEVDAARQLAEGARQQYEGKVTALAEEREHTLDRACAEIARERAKILDQARAQAVAEAGAARLKLDDERRAAVGELERHAVTLALDVARRLLDRAGGTAAAEAFFARVCDHLDALQAAQLAGLRSDLSGHVLHVRVAPPLDKPREHDWRERLAARLGSAAIIEFTAEPSLIAGVELRFPHTAIAMSFRDSLAAAAQEMLQDAHAR